MYIKKCLAWNIIIFLRITDFKLKMYCQVYKKSINHDLLSY